MSIIVQELYFLNKPCFSVPAGELESVLYRQVHFEARFLKFGGVLRSSELPLHLY